MFHAWHYFLLFLLRWQVGSLPLAPPRQPSFLCVLHLIFITNRQSLFHFKDKENKAYTNWLLFQYHSVRMESRSPIQIASLPSSLPVPAWQPYPQIAFWTIPGKHVELSFSAINFVPWFPENVPIVGVLPLLPRLTISPEAETEYTSDEQIPVFPFWTRRRIMDFYNLK